MTLNELNNGERAIITRIGGSGAFRKRIMEMGFISGKEISHVMDAPLKDPVEYKLMDYKVCLRKSEANLIEIIKDNTCKKDVEKLQPSVLGISVSGVPRSQEGKNSKTINIALIGNPNCGKTTIFNYASGSKERVGNYSGVTVEVREAKLKYKDYEIILTDLPGTYSLSTYTPEELYVRDYILNNSPDYILNVVDSTNLERNLYLSLQLMELSNNMIVALNMYDQLKDNGDTIDLEKLSDELKAKVIPTVGTKGSGIKQILDYVINDYQSGKTSQSNKVLNFSNDIEESVSVLSDIIDDYYLKEGPANKPGRFAALKLLEGDNSVLSDLSSDFDKNKIIEAANSETNKIKRNYNEDCESVFTNARYSYISSIIKKVYQKSGIEKKKQTEIIDRIMTHKLFGLPIFLGFMWFTFYATFTLGEYPMELIESAIGFLTGVIGGLIPEGIVHDLVVDGIFGGALGVLVFLPNILILYFFIALMEDTGYMARAVFLMDKLMHKIGLDGKSFIPLLIGFGCNVPSILSSRMIESRKDRLVTMLINPFMSCSARLPVYVLFISAFFVSHETLVLFSIYFIGIILAIISAIVFKKTLFKTPDMPFIIELPPYRIPTFKALSRHMWIRSSQYLKKVGGIIMVASIIVWALGYFPRNVDFSKDYNKEIQTLKIEKQNIVAQSGIQTNLNDIEEEFKKKIAMIKMEMDTERREKSYIGMIGKSMAPVMEPLGFDWKMNISILTGIAAKEIIVGTMGVLYQVPEESDSKSLVDKLQQQKFESGSRKGQQVFTPLIAFSFMVFILLYFPCTSVVAAIKRESGNWKWAVFSIVYPTILAWGMAYIVKTIGTLIG